jgi:NAD(P)H dehydrogenase (quinone)
MTYVISGASSGIAKSVAKELLNFIEPDQLTMVSRNPAKLKDWADKGVNVVLGNPVNRDQLEQAYAGAKYLFLVSGLNIGERIIEHKNAIDTAKTVGIEHITYTSVSGAHKQNPTPSAHEHIETEMYLYDSGLSFAAMRNQPYFEHYAGLLGAVVKKGKWRHHGEKGLTSPVSTDDIVASTVGVMKNPEKHDRVVYEITGPEQFTFPELASLASKVFGTKIEYINISADDMQERYDQIGWPRDPDMSLPQPTCFGSTELVTQFVADEAGFLDVVSGHVKLITGKAPQKFENFLREYAASNT